MGSAKRGRATPWEGVPEVRRRTMAAIKGRDTKPELAVRSLLHRLGYRYRVHAAGLPGRPDIIFPGRHKAIFVHGCFWHGHEGCGLNRAPKSRRHYWDPKLQSNKDRDARVRASLEALGWQSAIVWECETANSDRLAAVLVGFLGAAKWIAHASVTEMSAPDASSAIMDANGTRAVF